MKTLSILITLSLTVLGITPACAQDFDGQISGRVVDPGGRPLPNYRVELDRPSSYGRGRLLGMTDADGHFRYTNLRPGRYAVVLTDGRRAVASEEVELSAGRMEVDDVTLTQPARPARRISRDRLLQGQPMPESLEALSALLAPGGYGYEVIVKDESGERMRGRVTSISANALVLNTRTTLPLIRLIAPREGVFAAESVTRVEIVDSLWNGFLIGTVGAIGGFFAAPYLCSSLSCLTYSALAIGTLPVLGMAIDQEINQPIYQQPSQPARVTFAPLFPQGQKGILAEVRFQF